LAHVLRDLPVDALFASQFRRTGQTLAPLADRLELPITVAPLQPDDLTGSLTALARRILAEYQGKTVVVAGHSNTVPALIEALGVAGAPALTEQDYDDLFVVTAGGGHPAAVMRLHYGTPTP
jgi:broad specificity phosphatase PhoE